MKKIFAFVIAFTSCGTAMARNLTISCESTSMSPPFKAQIIAANNNVYTPFNFLSMKEDSQEVVYTSRNLSFSDGKFNFNFSRESDYNLVIFQGTVSHCEDSYYSGGHGRWTSYFHGDIQTQIELSCTCSLN